MSRSKSWLVAGGVSAVALLAAVNARAAPVHAATMTQFQSKSVCVDPHPVHVDFAHLVVGFSQSESNANPFRAAETKSVKDAAASLHVKRLIYTNAHSNEARQVADVENMINQGAQALVIAPLNATGLQPAFAQAAAKHIPIITLDRHTAGTMCTDYLSFMGSNFYVKQGEISGRELAKATHGHAIVAEIQGAYGNSVEAARTKGFAEALKQYPGMKIVAEQTGNWFTTDGEKVMSQILLAHPNVNAVYTQSDTMAFGAITALRDAGKKPGQVKIVTIDGTKQGVQDIVDGWIYADDETNPRFGPLAWHEIGNWFDGKKVPQHVVLKDHLYTKANAASALKANVPF
ncbi:ABC transporter substrate-binding protein [Acidiphilium sp. AL]|uniref:ABC transporter substrate-binding protein n=1 Tax=Acidiphilium iwatense TaxID=768198 RepID=A0ABS9DUL5_9PROT|nr:MULTISPECIES: ABC transporter substrate-binding protein [Acidiphilium]MCF3946387.1 ABC transporter substrate-binding protein [Acidiphilium iwatense]MCU4159830.1 ABC transporter substrate-binding protein [Acidiphilium sp. AL]